MKTKQLRIVTTIAFAAFLCGCAVDRGLGYGNPDDGVFGTPEELTYTDKSRAIVDMVGRMLTDPDFTVLYRMAKARAEKRGHARPTIAVTRIEDNTRIGGMTYSPPHRCIAS